MGGAKLFDPRAPRQRLDRYELMGEIASGGMATVFLARLTGAGGFQRFFAMKRLHPHLANEEEFVEMFLDEARLAAGIHHPNVVSILEVGASPIGYYLVMEYVEGDTLARLLARAASQGQRLPIPVALRILLDALAGLHGAHELRDDRGELVELVHRDVSPQNVLVGVDGVARITDFGVARAQSRLSATRVGQLKGKLAYMAPEQATGGEIDRRADVFSVGVMIWETLASKRLFKAETEAATLSRVLNEPIPELLRAAPGTNGRLSRAVMRALERDPTRRFGTAAELADALETAAQDIGIAGPRDVATFVKAMLGEEIDQQRDAVRAWLARSEPSHGEFSRVPPAPSSVSAVSFQGEEGSRFSSIPARRRSKAPFVLAMALLLPLAGGAGFWFAQQQPLPPAPVAVPAAVAPHAAEPTTEPSVEPAPVTIPETPIESDARADASAGVPSAGRPAGAFRRAPVRRKQAAVDDLDVRNPYR